MTTIRLKRRTGLRLTWAVMKTFPKHYRLLRERNGRPASAWLAFRLCKVAMK
jgi:hypothetical protein